MSASEQPASVPMGVDESRPGSIRARSILRLPTVWVLPALLTGVLILLMTFTYIGSVVNPAGHLHGLPVLVVDEDAGATTSSGTVNFGQALVAGLTHTAALDRPLHLSVVTMAQAERSMNKGADYATVVIPSTFSASLLDVAGVTPSASSVPLPALQLLENIRGGSIGVSLASAVLTPATATASHEIATQLAKMSTEAARANPVDAARLADPISLVSTDYRPLPSHTALGLSAFYIALLAIMCGFLGATVVNSSIDAALGYGPTEIGPRYRQRRPLPIRRLQTLLVKWAVASGLVPLLTAVLLAIAVGVLGMNAPHVLSLWLFISLAAVSVALGTLVLFAALGSLGQLVAMILFVYLALASSGGTVPIQALPGFFRGVGYVEPLRLILGGTRSILYFNARADAGLAHSAVVIAIELVVWLALGIAVTTWYDRRNLHRLAPEVISFVERAVDAHEASLEAKAPVPPA